MIDELIAESRKHAQAAQFNAGILTTLATVMAATLPGFKQDGFDNLLAHMERTTVLMNRCADALTTTQDKSQ